ncbi:MAG: PIN domain-containing protein [Akkermansiaceae bacterium]|jgi:predicted nucleic acid-binding protein
MAVLAHTNIWVKHFRSANPLLGDLLEDNEVLCHPVVIGELSMGNLAQRELTIRDFESLARPQEASWAETRHLVESRQLYGKGLQWNDVLLLASCLISNVPLWTLDARLAHQAELAGVGFKG